MAFRGLLDRMGEPTERLYRQQGLPVFCEDPSAFVPLSRAWSFFDAVVRRVYPGFGWHVGRFIGDKSLNDRLLQRLEKAPTLNLALGRLVDLIRLESSHLQVGIRCRGDDVRFFTGYPGIEDAPGYHVSQAYQLGIYIDVVRHFVGRNWVPAEMGIQSSTIPIGLPELFPGCRILSGQRIGYIAIPRSELHKQANHRDPDVADDSFVMTDRFDYVGTLAAMLRAYLPDGYPSARFAAGLMDRSERTLARELSSHNLTYGALIDEVRFKKSAEMLRETDERIANIGYEVGFDDPAHFARMFVRIAGLSPREYRKATQNCAEDGAV